MSINVIIKALLSTGLILLVTAQASATECTQLEFAELQSMKKSDLVLEYCVTKISRDTLTQQLDLSAEGDRLKLERQKLDGKVQSSIGASAKEEMKARDACDTYLSRIERIAKTKNYKLQCRS